jgi:two-component system, NarL family, nitrate/nitrite response regulator NarL
MIRILIVGSIRLYREGLAQLLAQYDGVTVVGAVSDAESALAALPNLLPDVVLLDMATPDSHQLARELHTRAPGMPFVAIGIVGSDVDLLECAETGAAGCVTREASVDELLAAARSAGLGEPAYSPRTVAQLVRRLADLSGERMASGGRSRLTPRESEIAALLAQNLSNKEIARRLRIEVATVKNHVHNLLEKLHIHRRAEAAGVLRSEGFGRRVSAAPALGSSTGD